MNNSLKINKKTGRKKTHIEWPTSEFSVKDIESSLNAENKSLSAVSIQLKVNKAVEEGTLIRLEKTRPSGGCPSRIYKKTESIDISPSVETICVNE